MVYDDMATSLAMILIYILSAIFWHVGLQLSDHTCRTWVHRGNGEFMNASIVHDDPCISSHKPCALHIIFYRITQWGRVTHLCVSKLTSIGSDNGLSPGRRQAIIWTNAGILLIAPLGTNFSEILIEIHTFSFRKMHLKMSSGKWRPFCLGLNMIIGLSVEYVPDPSVHKSITTIMLFRNMHSHVFLFLPCLLHLMPCFCLCVCVLRTLVEAFGLKSDTIKNLNLNLTKRMNTHDVHCFIFQMNFQNPRMII